MYNRIVESPSRNGNGRVTLPPGHQGNTDADGGPDAPSIKLTLDGGDVLALTPEQLGDEEELARTLAACDSARHVSVDLEYLPHFDDRDALAIVSVLDRLPNASFSSRATVGDTDLFEVVVDLIPPGDDLRLYARAKTIALYVAALQHPNGLDAACARILQRIRGQGVKGVRAYDLVREARGILAEAGRQSGGSAEMASEVRVRDLLSDAPVSDEAVVPPGWTLRDDGIYSMEEGDCIPAPIVIVERGKDSATGSELWRLAWYRGDAWHERLVSRVDASTTRMVVELAEYGAPVTSNNAYTVVQYLADYENVNLEFLPVVTVARRLGFHAADGESCFLWGRRVITATGIGNSGGDDADTGDGIRRTHVIFRGADEGDEQLAEAFHPAGDFEKWRSAIQLLADHPKAKLALYAALTPPLLHVLNSPNFCVDLSGETTTGKTTVLRAAASCWGNSDEQSNEASAIKTWNGTSVYTERLLTTHSHLPVILDDTKHASPEQVAAVIYAVTQGKGRGRGTVKGTARQESSQTVLISSGEQPATSFTQDGGLRGRVLTLWGPPFEETTLAMGRAIRGMNDQLRLHYGHAGPLFVRWILENEHQWNAAVRGYRKRIYERDLQFVFGYRLPGEETHHLDYSAGAVREKVDAQVRWFLVDAMGVELPDPVRTEA
ncbi:MAG: DUF927 domain-containing protein [Pirellulaceae bacterium]